MVMARTINGIHRENRGFSWNWEDSLRITDRFGGNTLLDDLLTDGENGFWYPQLRRVMGPEHLIHIRCYSETGWIDPTFGRHWCDVDPAAWAAECVRRLSAERLRYNGLRPIDDPFVVVTFANEQDLAVEGHLLAATAGDPTIMREVYEDMFHWSTAVRREFRRLAPDSRCLIATDPLAGGHDVKGCPPDYEYQLPEFRDLLSLCDVIMLHAYFNPDGTGTRPDNGGYWVGIRCLRPAGYREAVQGYPPVGGIPDPGGVAVQYPNRAFIVSEFGNFRHDDSSGLGVQTTLQGYRECYQAYADSGRCALVTPFLWNSADEHRQNRIRGNELLTNGLIGLQRYAACDWPPMIPQPEEPTVTTYHLGNIDITDLRDTLAVHPTLRYETRPLTDIKRIVIHHSATSVNATAQQFAQYHVNQNWPGIGYHFVVTAAGAIQYVNDHSLITYGVSGQNTDTVHICLVGDFSTNPPPDAQIEATKRLIDNYRFAMGQVYPVFGHTEIAPASDPTSCPGATWPSWKARLEDAPTPPAVDWQARAEAAEAKLASIRALL